MECINRQSCKTLNQSLFNNLAHLEDAKEPNRTSSTRALVRGYLANRGVGVQTLRSGSDKSGVFSLWRLRKVHRLRECLYELHLQAKSLNRSEEHPSEVE